MNQIPNIEEEMIAFVEVDGVGVALFESDAGLKLTVSGSKEFIKEIPLNQQLQKARESVLKELIEYYDYYGNKDELIQVQTLVKQLKGYLLTPASDHSELDQDTPKE